MRYRIIKYVAPSRNIWYFPQYKFCWLWWYQMYGYSDSIQFNSLWFDFTRCVGYRYIEEAKNCIEKHKESLKKQKTELEVVYEE